MRASGGQVFREPAYLTRADDYGETPPMEPNNPHDGFLPWGFTANQLGRASPGAHLDILLEMTYYSPRMSTRAERGRIDLLQGTLDLLILRTLLWGPAHGHAIAKTIEHNSEDVLQVEQGSLYPALHRLIKRGWISAEAGTSENNRRAKYYRLTARGRKHLNIETNKWDKLAGAIGRILRPAEQGDRT